MTGCDGTLTQLERVDDSCPVRQAAVFDLAGSFLLQNGNLYTWAVNDGRNGFAFLRRPSVTNASQSLDPSYRYAPAPVQIDGSVAQFSSYNATLVSIAAISESGETFGWGLNEFCQAIGRRSSGSTPCSSIVHNERVLTPTRVDKLNDVTVTEIRTAACTTWAIADNDEVYSWGGAYNIASFSYSWCDQHPSGAQSFNFTAVSDPTSASEAFSKPVTGLATGTIRIK